MQVLVCMRVGAWESTETLVKMEDISFARGAMRECFRMKKMSQQNASFFYKMRWEECNNYVAKRCAPPPRRCQFPLPISRLLGGSHAHGVRLAHWLKLVQHLSRECLCLAADLVAETPRDRYFSDIQMQMISKRYARLYNQRAPPKKVDFLLVRYLRPATYSLDESQLLAKLSVMLFCTSASTDLAVCTRARTRVCGWWLWLRAGFCHRGVSQRRADALLLRASDRGGRVHQAQQ